MDVDKALRRRVIEGIGGVVGGQPEVVQREGALATYHGAGPLEELQLHRARHALLGVAEEGIERFLQRREPQAVVHLLGPGLLDGELVVQHAPLQTEVLEGLVGLDEGKARGHLVALAALHAHKPVLHHVDAAEAVGPGDLVQGVDDTEEAHGLAVHSAGDALLKIDLHVGGRIGGARRVGGHGVDVRRRLAPGVFQNTALDGAAPQVVVDGIGSLGRGFHRHIVSRGPGDLIGPAAQIPVAYRREDRERGVQHEHRGFEAHLVVALARAAVGDVLGAELVGHRHEMLGDERTRQGADEGILVLVKGIGGQSAGEVLVGEGLAHVHHGAPDGAGGERLGLHGLKPVVFLAQIAHHGDDVEVVFLLQPLDAHRGIETARIGEHHALLLTRRRRGGKLRDVVERRGGLVGGNGMVALGHDRTFLAWA